MAIYVITLFEKSFIGTDRRVGFPTLSILIQRIYSVIGGIMAKLKVTEIVENILKDFLVENHLELYNIEFVKEGKDWFLRVYVDKISDNDEEEYVSTDDCEKVSRFLSEELDEKDPIEQNYYLEVCSPGLDRTLLKASDYERFAGRLVDVSLYKAFEGKKTYNEIKLVGLKDGILIFQPEPKEEVKKGKGRNQKKSIQDDMQEELPLLEIPFEQVSKVKLAVIF